MKRRDFITLLGGAVAPWSFQAWAQQSEIPVIGFLGGSSPEANVRNLAEFRRGLGESGYIEGRNLTIEYRWADGRYDRLPEMASDLVRRGVNVIVAAANNQ